MPYSDTQAMIELNAIKKQLNITDWEKAMFLLPAETPGFLTPAEYLSAADFCGLDKDTFPLLDKTAGIILSDPVLLPMAWYLYWKMYLSAEQFNGIQSKLLPGFEDKLGKLNGVFYLLIVLGIIPFMRSYHKHLGIPENITKETAGIVKSLVESYRRGSGNKTGVFARPIYWLQYYIHDNLYLGIGRFAYWVKSCSDKMVRVYKNKKSGRIIAFVPPDMLFNQKGYCNLPEAKGRERNYWRSVFELTDHTVTGNPVLPCGKALRDTRTLARDEWDCVLDQNSVFIDIHIPAGGNMNMEVCRDSLIRAADFFGKYFPRVKPAAITCHSWICSPNLSEFMPENSNLIKFQKECFLYPEASAVQGGLWFFFFRDTFDSLKVPRDSSLQKTIAKHLESGHELREGGMFILFEDIKYFGSQKYQENAAEF
ncbi:MAG: hypothetical protein PHV82_08795 [Victivallaceae bacterium]|nr:hypothetical protein [Victivallaceae bacterium]